MKETDRILYEILFTEPCFPLEGKKFNLLIIYAALTHTLSLIRDHLHDGMSSYPEMLIKSMNLIIHNHLNANKTTEMSANLHLFNLLLEGYGALLISMKNVSELLYSIKSNLIHKAVRNRYEYEASLLLKVSK